MVGPRIAGWKMFQQQRIPATLTENKYLVFRLVISVEEGENKTSN